MQAIGVDIGGTKCAVSLGRIAEEGICLLHKCQIRVTRDYTPEEMLAALADDIRECMALADGGEQITGIGISCGGPLDSRAGVILSPPNLPGWDRVEICRYFREKTGLRAWLCNDANACALAEWKYGAGKGANSMVFMTFGTGLGAGIILDSRLYVGASDTAGELGHIRLSENGPVGYGKRGSFEGFCSGGGIAQMAKSRILEELQQGKRPALCSDLAALEEVTAERVGIAAKNGDPLALSILQETGRWLGAGLSVLIDILNPEKIVIGSIFTRCHEELWPWAEEIIKKETLSFAYQACEVVPSALSESVGDWASLLVAYYFYQLEACT